MSAERLVFTLVHAPGDDVEIERQPSVYAPRGIVYLVPPKSDFLTMARTMYSLEQERNDWIRRYDNALAGLNYWKARAQEI
jgi:hypothetical protein